MLGINYYPYTYNLISCFRITLLNDNKSETIAIYNLFGYSFQQSLLNLWPSIFQFFARTKRLDVCVKLHICNNKKEKS